MTDIIIKAKRNPKVSVIVAAYNQERFIGRCLRSLLHQTLSHDDYEIIVVDDGSIDSTSFAINLFLDPGESVVKVITNKKNLGLPASLNKAIISSNSEYIVRVDSDDFVNTNFLNILCLYLDSNADADAVACDYLLLDDTEAVLGRGDCAKDPIACGIMFRRKHLMEIGLYDEDFRCQEDRELRFRFDKKYKIKRLELPLYRYRRHQSNITNDSKQMERYKQFLIEKHGKKGLN